MRAGCLAKWGRKGLFLTLSISTEKMHSISSMERSSPATSRAFLKVPKGNLVFFSRMTNLFHNKKKKKKKKFEVSTGESQRREVLHSLEQVQVDQEL